MLTFWFEYTVLLVIANNVKLPKKAMPYVADKPINGLVLHGRLLLNKWYPRLQHITNPNGKRYWVFILL